MSRTTRSIRHWTTYQTEQWTPEFQLRVQRNQDSICKLRWPTMWGGHWGWDDDYAGGQKSRPWLKRLAAKMRRRRGQREIQQQLDEQ